MKWSEKELKKMTDNLVVVLTSMKIKESIFPQILKQAHDMSVTFGQDLQQAIKKINIALSK